MTWILITYLLGLFYFTANQDKVLSKIKFRAAWILFALVPVKNFVFTVFTVEHMRSPRDLALVEVWSNGFTWLLLGISLFAFIAALIPADVDEPPKFNLDDNRVQ